MSRTELQRKDRSTRAKRYQAALNDELEKDDADQSFWGQDFFQEEAADNDYEEEHVSDDVPDSDFDEEDDEDEDEELEEEEREKPRKKALKPPGRVSAPRPKAAAKPKTGELSEEEDLGAFDDDEDEEEADGRGFMEAGEAGPSGGSGELGSQEGDAATKPAKKKAVAQHVAPVYQAPSLRRSTMAKVEMAENIREWKEQERQEQRPRKRKAKDDGWRPMTQQELLADAARTEVENTASLKILLAMEAETKRRAAIVKKNYVGPSVKFHSVKVNDEERTSLRVINMHYPPPWLRRMKAPPPAPRQHCLVTGLPAKYRDPHTGQHFSSVGALKRLRGETPPSLGLLPGSGGMSTGFLPPGPLTIPAAPLLGAESSSGALGSPSGGGLTSPRGRVQVTTTHVDRTVSGSRTQQVRAELALADQALARAAAPPRVAYELPLELMALVLDLRAGLRKQMGRA